MFYYTTLSTLFNDIGILGGVDRSNSCSVIITIVVTCTLKSALVRVLKYHYCACSEYSHMNRIYMTEYVNYSTSLRKLREQPI